VDLCTVTWWGRKYRVECTPSHLLALAAALAEGGLSYIEVYRELARQVAEARGYREVAGRVGSC
jgi:cell division protein ZapA (FtsZ GTPase activity inhibitor)